MTLIDDCRLWWRFWSVRLQGLLFLVTSADLMGLFNTLPPEFRAMRAVQIVQAVLIVATVLARVLPQRKLEADRAQG